MKKQTKVLVAATMLTLGASFSAMAAEKGTWDKSTGEWMCYDKDGEAYEEEWCLDDGIEFWVNDDGVLGASEWVEGDNDVWYYVQSDGSKAKGVWKYIFGMDEDDDTENWYYFDAKGKMIDNEVKKIGDYYYAFGENGEMLTGWVEKLDGQPYQAADDKTPASNVYYFNENGDRASKVWLNCFPYGKDEDTDDLYVGEHEVDYYIASSGKPQTGINKDIDGLTYFFDSTNGQMLSGWIGTDNGTKFEEIEDNAKDAVSKWTTVYHTNDIGYAAKDKWEKLEAPNTDDEYWYWFDKNGKVYKPTAGFETVALVSLANGDDNTFTSSNAELADKRIDGQTYYFNAEGQMAYGLIEMGDATSSNVYYYGTEDQGTMQTGSYVIEDADGYEFDFYFAPKTDSEDGYVKGAAVTGNANGYLYSNGQLMKATEEDANEVFKVVIDGVEYEFLVNDEGKIQHKDKKDYDMVGGFTKAFEFDSDAEGVLEDHIDNEYVEA